jgi:hypothetical protein
MVTATALLTIVAGWAAAAPRQEQTRVRALLVIDTNSSLGDSVTIDRSHVESLLHDGIPQSQYDVTVLQGDRVTRENILNYYRKLKTDPSETLLFFYAGHGATDPKTRQHYFCLQAPRKNLVLTRAELRQTMQSKQAGLVVLLTDCCSNYYTMPRRRATVTAVPPPKTIRPVLKCLLFQHKGLVDVTASELEPSWGDDNEGGVFTRTLTRLMSRDLKSLDSNEDGFVSWKEFFPVLQKATRTTFVKWADEQRRLNGQRIDQRSQKPHAYFPLPDGARSGGEKAYAVVSLTNRKTEPVQFRYRWSGTTGWHQEILASGKTTTLLCQLSDADPVLPVLELQEDGESKIERLEARRWTGPGTPAFMDGKRYSIRP